MSERLRKVNRLATGAAAAGLGILCSADFPQGIRPDFSDAERDTAKLYGSAPITFFVETPYWQLPKWREFDRPTSIAIGQIGFSDTIQPVNQIPVSNGINSFEVPDFGVATPLAPFKNHVYIFGHSRFHGEKQPFSDIINLKLGDIFLVANQRGEPFFFMIVEFKLLRLDGHDSFIGHESQFKLTLQTTVKEGNWILDKDLVLSKVGLNRTDDLSSDLVLWIISKPVEVRGLD